MRPFVELLRKYYRDNPLVGIEIGVYRGEHALHLLRNLNIARLYLIDPYEAYDEVGSSVNHREITQEGFDKLYEGAQQLLEPYKDRIKFVREKSNEAFRRFTTKVDFLYIDGNHKFEYVKSDLADYFHRVKERGIIGGDNLEIADVANVVIPFFFMMQLKLHASRKDDSYEWWGVKETPFWTD